MTTSAASVSPAASAPTASRTWCELSTGALRTNVRTLAALVGPQRKLGVVVKADGYGHGIVAVARVLVAEGVHWLIVNAVDEARVLRDAGITAPIYICGPVFPFEAEHVVQTQARVVLYEPEVARALDAAARARGAVVPVHIKIETGTHRQGLELKDALAFGASLRGLSGLTLEGLTTHYADIEDTTDHGFADSQRDALAAARAAFAEAGTPVQLVHGANSAATILDPRTHGDLVRVGIAAYGLWPSRETLAAWQERRGQRALPVLAPALAWRARLAQVKDVPSGAYVGYGRTYRTTRPSRIGIVPVGYHEGYDRRLSNVAHTLIHGARAPVRGRVCMNMLMVDVTDCPQAQAGSVVTLLGADGDERISAEQLAAWMGSIHYEVVSRLHPSVPRVTVP